MGTTDRYEVVENSVMEPELQQKYPNIRSYIGIGVENPEKSIRFSLSPYGFNATIFNPEKGESTLVQKLEENNYAVYLQKDAKKENDFICHTEGSAEIQDSHVSEKTSTESLFTFKLALACTNDFVAARTSSSMSDNEKKAAIVTKFNEYVTHINSIYERDVYSQFILVGNTDDLIYTDAATDPYTPGAGIGWINENQTNINSVIGISNYYVGYLIVQDGEGGRAAVGAVCNGNKAQGYSGGGNDEVWLKYVLLHELGHMLGADHSFSYTYETPTSSRMEPGSGSSIMGYNQVAPAQYVVSGGSIIAFHSRSIQQILFSSITSGSCATQTVLAQDKVIADPNGATAHIPVATPFVLKANPSGNISTATYSWEQWDPLFTPEDGAASIPDPTRTYGPAFKMIEPTTSPNRYIPAIATVINGATSNTWEVVNTVARHYSIELQVRDNIVGGGTTAREGKSVIQDATSGPFIMTSQNTEGITWFPGLQESITWNVANTNNSIVNCQTVNIKLSTDGGNTYPVTLAENISNDGAHTISVPSLPTTTARVLIEPTDNVFYDISNFDITIDTTTPNIAIHKGTESPISCNGVGNDPTFNFTASYVNGATGTMNFSASNLPPGAFASFSPSSLNASGEV